MYHEVMKKVILIVVAVLLFGGNAYAESIKLLCTSETKDPMILENDHEKLKQEVCSVSRCPKF